MIFLQDFILEHYSEDGNNLDDAIQSFMELRQVCEIELSSLGGIFEIAS